MGSICLWGTGGTHYACPITAGMLHMVTCNHRPQFLSAGVACRSLPCTLTRNSGSYGIDQNNDPTGRIGPSAFCVSSMGDSEVHNVGPPHPPRTASDHSPFSLSASCYAGPSLCPRSTLQGATTKVPAAEESRPPGNIPRLNTVQSAPTGPLD